MSLRPRAVLKAVLGDPGVPGLVGDREFDPRQVRSCATVGTDAERDVAGASPIEVDLVRIVEHFRVSVGGNSIDEYTLALSDEFPTDLDVLNGSAPAEYEGLDAQHLLDRTREERAVCAEPSYHLVPTSPLRSVDDLLRGVLVKLFSDRQLAVEETVIERPDKHYNSI